MKMYMSGSEAIAWGIKLARVQMVCAYPITPNTPSLQAISDLIASGEMDAEQINAESELDAQNICAGAEAVGVRSFNCTNSQGFALMREIIDYAKMRGIGELTGDILTENRTMRAMAHKFGFVTLTNNTEPGQVRVSLDLRGNGL